MKIVAIFTIFLAFIALQAFLPPAQAAQDALGATTPAVQNTQGAPLIGAEKPPADSPDGVRGFLPMILMVGLYLLLRRTFRGMRGGSQGDSASRPRSDQDVPEHLRNVYDAARKQWGTYTARPGEDTPAGEPRPAQTGGFDEDEFLDGSRLVFVRIVEGMDRLDVDVLTDFVGAELTNEVKRHLNAGDQPVESEIMQVDAKVMERGESDGIASVSVYYDALKRIPGLETTQIRQVWTFTKDDNDPEANWMLQSMEPVEG